MFSVQCLQLGLHGYLIRFAPLAFIPHCQSRNCKVPSLIVSPIKIKAFYCYLDCTPYIFRSLAMQYLLHAPSLRLGISQKTYKASYGCFRPNKCGYYLDCRDYRGGWHRSYPVLIRHLIYRWQKFFQNKEEHFGSLYHAFAHCKKSLTAAPRRARTSVSESFSGLLREEPL